MRMPLPLTPPATAPNPKLAGAYKASLTTRNTTAVLAVDPDLVFPVLKDEIWAFEYVLVPTFGTTGGLSVAVNAPAGTTGGISASTVNLHTIGNKLAWDATSLITLDTETADVVYVDGCLLAGADGSISLLWCQKVSNATPTVMNVGSYVKAQRIN